ncbi:MAG TPA: hypothetical protein VFY55_01080 [Nitrososphaeraceae archaeon]|jgi:hypothetical protein|nr:hypothetical protein [Nitrososphaeraceae archaeon]
MNEKKSCPNEIYYDDRMKSIWIQYGHTADDEEELPACEKEVK